jgi:hypothetical protein
MSNECLIIVLSFLGEWHGLIRFSEICFRGDKTASRFKSSDYNFRGKSKSLHFE